MKSKKRKKFPAIMMGVLLGLVAVSLHWSLNTSPEFPRWIAHAGGGYQGKTYTNSLQAMSTNYDSGFRFFEVDFMWTNDDRLVLIHDWDKSFQDYFETDGVVPSLEEFKSLRMRNSMTQMSLEDLIAWLDKHSKARIITDVKERNIEALQKIRDSYPEFLDRFIPQIYHFKEYLPVKEAGYTDIILTLYRMQTSVQKVLAFAKSHKLYAVCMWSHLAVNERIMKPLREAGIPVFAHTVNDEEKSRTLFAGGVAGIYTDFLGPGKASQ